MRSHLPLGTTTTPPHPSTYFLVSDFRSPIKQMATTNSLTAQRPKNQEEREALKEKVRNLLKNKEFEMYKAPAIYGRASWLLHLTAVAQLICWMVSRMSIIQNKDIMAKIENDMKLPFLRTRIIPIKDLHCDKKLFSGVGESGHEAPKGKRFPAMILKKGDQFTG
ncbi:9033_t:CDS:2, partial [Acaulospora colombiana]